MTAARGNAATLAEVRAALKPFGLDPSDDGTWERLKVYVEAAVGVYRRLSDANRNPAPAKVRARLAKVESLARQLADELMDLDEVSLEWLIGYETPLPYRKASKSGKQTPSQAAREVHEAIDRFFAPEVETYKARRSAEEQAHRERAEQELPIVEDAFAKVRMAESDLRGAAAAAQREKASAALEQAKLRALERQLHYQRDRLPPSPYFFGSHAGERLRDLAFIARSAGTRFGQAWPADGDTRPAPLKARLPLEGLTKECFSVILMGFGREEFAKISSTKGGKFHSLLMAMLAYATGKTPKDDAFSEVLKQLATWRDEHLESMQRWDRELSGES